MPLNYKPEHLDEAHQRLVEIDRPAVGVSWDNPPTRRHGPAPDYVMIVAVADEEASKYMQTVEIDGKPVKAGPWVHYPDDEQPIVRQGVQQALTKTFGPGSEYHLSRGSYFQAQLRKTVAVPSTTGKSISRKGVIYVRKVTP